MPRSTDEILACADQLAKSVRGLLAAALVPRHMPFRIRIAADRIGVPGGVHTLRPAMVEHPGHVAYRRPRTSLDVVVERVATVTYGSCLLHCQGVRSRPGRMLAAPGRAASGVET